MTSVTFTENSKLNIIEDHAFRSSGVTSIIIPDSVTTIGNYTFRGCSALTSVTLPQNPEFTTIGWSAFYDCNLSSVTIPDSVNSFLDPWNTFAENSNLTEIIIGSSNTAYANNGDGILYNKEKTKLIKFPEGKSGPVDILDSVATIGNHAFESCDHITSVMIPDSVTTIEKYAFRWAGHTSITIGSGVTSIVNNTFYDCNLSSVTINSQAPIVASDGIRAGSGQSFYGAENVTITIT